MGDDTRVGKQELYFLVIFMALIGLSFRVWDISGANCKPGKPTIKQKSHDHVVIKWDAPRDMCFDPVRDAQGVFKVSYCISARTDNRPPSCFGNGWTELEPVEHSSSYLSETIGQLEPNMEYAIRVTHGRLVSKKDQKYEWGPVSDRVEVWTNQQTPGGAQQQQKKTDQKQPKKLSRRKNAIEMKEKFSNAYEKARLVSSRAFDLTWLAFYGGFLALLLKSEASAQLSSILDHTFSLTKRRAISLILLKCIILALMGQPGALRFLGIIVYLVLALSGVVLTHLLWFHCKTFPYVSQGVVFSLVFGFSSAIFLSVFVYPTVQGLTQNSGALDRSTGMSQMILVLTLYAAWLIFVLGSITLVLTAKRLLSSHRSNERLSLFLRS